MYKHRYEEDPKWDLVIRLGKLAAAVRPDFVTAVPLGLSEAIGKPLAASKQ